MKPDQLVVEFLSADSMDQKEQVGWTELSPSREDIEDNDQPWLSPPITGFWRVPPSLIEYGPSNIIGRKISAVRKNLGTYGMGGFGWVGLEFCDQPPLMLIYCITSALDWIHFPKDDSVVNSVITDVSLAINELRLTCYDEKTQKQFVITANEQPATLESDFVWNKFRKLQNGTNYQMGELWRCCHPQGKHWA